MLSKLLCVPMWTRCYYCCCCRKQSTLNRALLDEQPLEMHSDTYFVRTNDVFPFNSYDEIEIITVPQQTEPPKEPTLIESVPPNSEHAIFSGRKNKTQRESGSREPMIKEFLLEQQRQQENSKQRYVEHLSSAKNLTQSFDFHSPVDKPHDLQNIQSVRVSQQSIQIQPNSSENASSSVSSQSTSSNPQLSQMPQLPSKYHTMSPQEGLKASQMVAQNEQSVTQNRPMIPPKPFTNNHSQPHTNSRPYSQPPPQQQQPNAHQSTFSQYAATPLAFVNEQKK